MKSQDNTTKDPEEASHWLRRLDALGKTQSRYFWILLIMGLFFLALHQAKPATQTITVPIVDLEIDASTVAASGPAVLAFLVLTSMGALRAWGRARIEYYRHSGTTGSERLDIHPSALDLAVYTTNDSNPVIRFITWMLYPFFLSLILFETGWLFYNLTSIREAPGWQGFAIAALVMYVPAFISVVRLWRDKIKRASDEWGKLKKNK